MPCRCPKSVVSCFGPLLLGLFAACRDADEPPLNPSGTGEDATSSSGGEAESSTSTTGPAEETGTTGDDPVGCTATSCGPHGRCNESEPDSQCECDNGYEVDDGVCVVDTECIKLRYLEDECRQIYDGVPAVALFFAVDYCAGTAVLPEALGDLNAAFRVFEDGDPVSGDVESAATVVEKDAESFVTLAIDASDSITLSEDLPTLITALQDLVTTLEPEAGQAQVHVAVVFFGRTVRTYIPHTPDLAAVKAGLQRIVDDPTFADSFVGGQGSALHEVVNFAIPYTHNIMRVRSVAMHGGILTTGTVVVVSDGKATDEMRALDTATIAATRVNVISIGISDEVDDSELQTIGRDGSFLAPTAADWPAAFAEIADRVDHYPDRAYLLAYCSSALAGTPTVEVDLGPDVGATAETKASCRFNADRFSRTPGVKCQLDFFFGECAGKTCGGLTACGGCADDQCCNATVCQAPATIADCRDQDELCALDGEICVEDAMTGVFSCEPPAHINQACGVGCEPGVSYCELDDMGQPTVCRAALGIGEECASFYDCESLHCERANPNSPGEPTTCRPPLTPGDLCAAGLCPPGTYCDGVRCGARKLDGQECAGSAECMSGLCEGVCQSQAVCAFPWDGIVAPAAEP